MNLQKISEAKDKMESMYNSIYDLQECLIEKNDSKKREVTIGLRSKAKELYLSLLKLGIDEKESNKLIITDTSVLILEQLITVACGYSIDELQKKTTEREYSLPRQVHMTFLNVTYGFSTTKSGSFYEKDHATVLHAKKVVRNLYQTNKDFREQYKSVIDHCIRFDLSRNSTKTQDFLNDK